MRRFSLLFLAGSAAVLAVGCDSDSDIKPPTPGTLEFYYHFDSTQQRLDNLGQPANVPAGHAAQSPRFRSMAAHYIELAPDQWTQVGQGAVIYQSPNTTAGGDTAIDYAQLSKKGEGELFFAMNARNLAPGTYRYVRVSLAYQNFDIDLWALGMKITASVAGFIGYNTFIGSHTIKDSTVSVNGNRLQGYVAVESAYSVEEAQTPGTTVPNPLAGSSPIPAGSCLVTGELVPPLVITGQETEPIRVRISLSTNHSFEWTDDGDGRFEPLDGEVVSDMGVRGLIGYVE